MEWLRSDQIDLDLWEACIASSEHPLIYGTYPFLNQLAKHWGAFVIMHNHSYEAVLPVTYKVFLGLSFATRFSFCQLMGAYGKEKHFGQLYEAFAAKFYIIQNHPTSPAFCWQYHKEIVKVPTIWLNINKPYPELFLNFSNSKKQNLGVSKKHKWVVSYDTDFKRPIAIYRKYQEHRIGRVRYKAYQILMDLFEKQRTLERAHLIVATSPETGQIEAASMFWDYGGRLIHQFSASTPFAKKKEGTTAIINFMIEQYAQKRTWLDFESTPLPGYLAWDAGFGGVEMHYNFVNKQPLWFSFAQKIRRWFI